MYGCRDCYRCTEPELASFILALPRFIFALLTFPHRIWQPRCPQCGHLLSAHERDEKGRFKD